MHTESRIVLRLSSTELKRTEEEEEEKTGKSFKSTVKGPTIGRGWRYNKNPAITIVVE